VATPIRIPITNINMEGDYTGAISVGPDGKVLNVILDTGSSALALDGTKYDPSFAGGEVQTNIAQTDSYGDGSNWTGAVIRTTVGVGGGVIGTGIATAVTYQASDNMFSGADGILGLAYQPLDGAYTMAAPTWTSRYSATQIVQDGSATTVVPCLMQLANEGLVVEKMAFLTRRSFIKAGPAPANDPLNQGVLILGGGEEATDLYTGNFQIAAVLADAWYCTNLKSVSVGGNPVPVSSRPAKGMPSNSIVDSGTNSLNLDKALLNAILGRLTPAQRRQLETSLRGDAISNSALDLASWPTLTFVLQGISAGADVVLEVSPGNYWQVDAPQPGQAMAAITVGQDGLTILGLPLMNGYFTIFDGTAGLGVIKFATAVPPA
jgi:Eukaryotic aspartyl protease